MTLVVSKLEWGDATKFFFRILLNCDGCKKILLPNLSKTKKEDLLVAKVSHSWKRRFVAISLLPVLIGLKVKTSSFNYFRSKAASDDVHLKSAKVRLLKLTFFSCRGQIKSNPINTNIHTEGTTKYGVGIKLVSVKWDSFHYTHYTPFLYKNVIFPAQAAYSYFSFGFRLKIFLNYSYL